jgi:mannitol/fructose-specific phosphotransferase system IIA component (Ntr-type)
VLLSELLTADRVRIPLGGRTKDDLLRELVALATAGEEPEVAAAVLAAVREREGVLSTGIGDGVAVPHGKTAALEEMRVAAGAVRDPVDYGAIDGAPVQLFFLLVGPESAPGGHVRALSRIARLLRQEPLRARLRAARTGDEFLRAIRESEEI